MSNSIKRLEILGNHLINIDEKENIKNKCSLENIIRIQQWMNSRYIYNYLKKIFFFI